jgi:ABC-type multidrug transport system ATPase subunit
MEDTTPYRFLARSPTDCDLVLSCSGIRFAYPNCPELLRGVDLQVGRDELIVIFGKSGTGKTTFLKCLLGYLKPTAGEVCWSSPLNTSAVAELPSRAEDVPPHFSCAGEFARIWNNILSRPQHKNMIRSLLYSRAFEPTMVFADCSNAFSQLTVRENLLLVLAPRQLGRELCDQIVSLALELTDLLPFGGRHANELSSGQLRRLCLAQSLASFPRLLVWDEPTVGLDLATKYEFLKIVQEVRRLLQIPGILVTHDVDAALFLASKICFFGHGSIIEELAMPQRTAEVDLGDSSDETRRVRGRMLRFLDPDLFSGDEMIS